ncbi:PKD domain-containing protein, partial [Lutibacter sp. HS1-25]|uniref:PKD domain-containing protein n=1 Tax=Lutibacter sp. HS1-25 TaxID=2485000 RepID=UPI001013A8C8
MKKKEMFGVTHKKGSGFFIVFLFLVTFISNSQFLSISTSVYDYFAGLSATLEVNPTRICLGESINITFKGEGGNGKYTFKYTINGKDESTGEITGNSTTIQYQPITNGNVDIVLVSVAGSDGVFQNISNESETVKVSKPIINDFTFNDNVCSGTAILFTPDATGDGNLTYSWDFGDGNNSIDQKPIHTYTTQEGCGVNQFNVTLEVTDTYGCSTKRTKVIYIKQRPKIDFIDLNPGNAGQFNNCGNPSSGAEYTVKVGNNNSSTCINSFNIDWGDGNTENNVTFPLTHTYSSYGTFNMVITGIGNNTCSNSATYVVKNATNPSGGISTPGNTQNLCAPTAGIIFEITGWGTNTSDTTYEIDFGDNSGTVTYTQSDLVNSVYYNAGNPSSSSNFPITPHSYTESSCPDEYTVKLWISNACKPNPTPATLSNILIIKSPEAKFEALEKACVNTGVDFINTTTGGFGWDCSLDGTYTWDFGDGSPIITRYSIQNENHIFSQPGVYNVILTAKNTTCDSTTFEKEICIEPPLVPLFSLSETEGCIPLNITTNNTTDESEMCSPPTYLWEVAYTAANCGTTGDWSFTNSTDQNSAAPTFLFKEAGIYTLKLTATNSCGSVSTSQDIEVKKPPTAVIDPIADFCGPTSISPVGIIENCTTDLSNLTYNWTFTGGTPTNSNQLNPGSINYSTPGLYTITLEVTNACGVSNTATEIFEIFPVPTITNTNLDQTVCSGTPTTEVILTSNYPNTTYSWTAIASAGITGYISSGNSEIIPVQTIFNSTSGSGTVIYTIKPKIDGCVGTSIDYIITVDPAATITSQPVSSEVCLGGVANLLQVTYVGPSTPTYQWYKNSVDATTGGTAITGANTATYDPPTDTVGTIYYYVVIEFASGGCSQITSNTAEVIVEEGITVAPPRTVETICNGGTATAMEVTYSGGTGTPSYQWYVTTTNPATGGIPISGATNASYTPPAYTSIGDYYYYVEVRLSGDGCGAVNSAIYQVTVVADPVIDT